MLEGLGGRGAAVQQRGSPRWCRRAGGGVAALDEEQTLGRCLCSWRWRAWQLEDAAGALQRGSRQSHGFFEVYGQVPDLHLSEFLCSIWLRFGKCLTCID